MYRVSILFCLKTIVSNFPSARLTCNVMLFYERVCLRAAGNVSLQYLLCKCGEEKPNVECDTLNCTTPGLRLAADWNSSERSGLSERRSGVEVLYKSFKCGSQINIRESVIVRVAASSKGKC